MVPDSFDIRIDGLIEASLIGSGGSASVYAATRANVGDRVAVKVLRMTASEHARRSFEKERRSLETLVSRASIVSVLDSGVTDDGSPYLVMPLLAGSAQDTLDDEGPMPWQVAATMTIDVAEALHLAHDEGILHRDIKPSNVLLTESGRPFLADFGISRLSDSSMSVTQGGPSYTPAFAPPEILRGETTGTVASDVFGLVATFAALVRGVGPFSTGDADTPISVMYRIMEQDPPQLSDVPAGIQALVNEGLAKDPEDRPSSPREVANRLRQQLEASGTKAPLLTTVAPTNPESSGRPTVASDAAPATNETTPEPEHVINKAAQSGGSTRYVGPKQAPPTIHAPANSPIQPKRNGKLLAGVAATVLAIAAITAAALAISRNGNTETATTNSTAVQAAEDAGSGSNAAQPPAQDTQPATDAVTEADEIGVPEDGSTAEGVVDEVPEDPETDSVTELPESIVTVAFEDAPPLVDVRSSHREAQSVATQFAVFVEGINLRRYPQAFDVRVAGFRDETLADFASGNATSSIQDFTIHDIDGVDTLLVRASFTSYQSSELSFNDASECTEWEIDYTMVTEAALWKISDADLVEQSDCTPPKLLSGADSEEIFNIGEPVEGVAPEPGTTPSTEIVATASYDPFAPVSVTDAVHPSWVHGPELFAVGTIEFDSSLGLFVDGGGAVYSSDSSYLYIPWLDRLVHLWTGQIYDAGIGWYYPPPPPSSSELGFAGDGQCSVIALDIAGLGSEILGLGC